MTEVSGAARRASHPRGFALCAWVRVSARGVEHGSPGPSRRRSKRPRSLRRKHIVCAYAGRCQGAARRPYGQGRAHPSGARRRPARAALRGAAAAHRRADSRARGRVGALALPAFRRPRGALPGRGGAAVRAHRADARPHRRVACPLPERIDAFVEPSAPGCSRRHARAPRRSAAGARVGGGGRLAPEHPQAEGEGGGAGVPPRAREGGAEGARACCWPRSWPRPRGRPGRGCARTSASARTAPARRCAPRWRRY